MASAKVSYGALKTEENNDPNGLKSASFDEEGVEVRTKPSGSRRTILAVVALALVGTALLVSISFEGCFRKCMGSRFLRCCLDNDLNGGACD